MARVGAILTLLLAIAAFVTCGFAVHEDWLRVAAGSGFVGFFLMVTSMVLFFKKGSKAKNAAPKPKKAKA